MGRVGNGMGMAYGGNKEWWLARVSVRAGLSLRREYVFLTLFIGRDWEFSGIWGNFVTGDDGAEFSGREEMDEERTGVRVRRFLLLCNELDFN